MNARTETIAVLHGFSENHIAGCEAKIRLTVSAAQLKEWYGRDIPTGTHRLIDVLKLLLE